MLHESAVIEKPEFVGFDFQYGEAQFHENIYFFGQKYNKNVMFEMNTETLECQEFQIDDRYFEMHRNYQFYAYKKLIIIISQDHYARGIALYLMDTETREFEDIPLDKVREMCILCGCIKDDRLFIFLNGLRIRVKTIDLITLKMSHRAQLEDYAILEKIDGIFLWCENHENDIYFHSCKPDGDTVTLGTADFKLHKLAPDSREFTYFTRPPEQYTLNRNFKKLYVIHNKIVMLAELHDESRCKICEHIMIFNLATRRWIKVSFDLQHNDKLCNIAVKSKLFLVDVPFDDFMPSERFFPKLRIYDFSPSLKSICESIIVDHRLDISNMTKSLKKKFGSYYHYK
ncbi:hypothetical protein CHUAL_009721 [Chamberlinius hualienensis]